MDELVDFKTKQCKSKIKVSFAQIFLTDTNLFRLITSTVFASL